MQDLERDEMISLLQTERDGFLAMCDEGQPYCLPFGYVFIEDSVYISLFPKGRKWFYLQKNPRVSFSVFAWDDDRTKWSSVVIDGELTMVEDLESIRSVVVANMLKMKLNAAEVYVEKRMRYYEQALKNPDGLRIMKLSAEDMGGKTMAAMEGN
jgi:nitroimidazol reductase NimA-like FMN-containing flavoprotein (pyridoxamine 5'-phosphate oxidase superfamily)